MNADPTTAPLLLTKPQAAALLGLSTRTLNRLLSAGKIGPRPIKLGGRGVFRRAELEAWAAAAVDGEFPDRATWASKGGAS